MLIYLASPYTHPDKAVQQERYEQVSKVTANLMNKGKVVFSPIAYGYPLALAHKLPTDWNYWRHTLETMLPRFDRLWVLKLPGWAESTGVKAEIFIATEESIPVLYFDLDSPLLQ